jgi:hypothetical protein
MMSVTIPRSRGFAAIPAILLICLALVTSACVTHPPADDSPWTIPSDKYVFIDHHVSRNGEVLNGTCGGGMMIDFPMYSFNRESGELSGMSARELEVNGSLKIVYGDGVSIGGVLGGGASTYLTPVYALPFTKGEVRITGVTQEGLVTLVSGNERISLTPGATWTNVTVTETRDLPGGDRSCMARVTTIRTMYHGGILEKSRILRDA